jgi:GTP-binding protein
LLVHLVDLAPFDGSDPAADAVAVVGELKRFSPELAARERWLVLNKTDLVSEDEALRSGAAVCAALGMDQAGQQPHVYRISALTGAGTLRLTQDLMTRLEELAAVGAPSGATGPEADVEIAPEGAPTSS